MARKPAAEDAAATVQGYVVQSQLQHDGAVFAAGDTVPAALFTEAQAAHLVACGTLVLIAPE